MSKKKLTKADLNKTLAELGFKEGDELTLPYKPNSDAKTNEGGESGGSEDDGEGGNGGGNNPGSKPPFTPPNP